MELDGAYPLELHGTVLDQAIAVVRGPPVYTANEALTNDFHVYAVIEPEQISFWLDDTRYQVLTHDLPSGTQWVFDGEFFVLLNLAIGGHFLENPDFDQLSGHIRHDYVRFLEPVE